MTFIPNRNKRNLDLSTEKEKAYNKSHSKKRIAIEHTICKLKKYKILAVMFGNKLRKHNKIYDIVTSLVNYRIMNQAY